MYTLQDNLRFMKQMTEKGEEGYYKDKQERKKQWLDFAKGEFTEHKVEQFIATKVRKDGQLAHPETLQKWINIIEEASPGTKGEGWLKFIKGYKNHLAELGYTKNYTNPVFPDHSIAVLEKMTKDAKKTKSPKLKQKRLAKCLSTSIMLFTGMRNKDVSQIQIQSLREEDNLIQLNPEVRKGKIASTQLIKGYMETIKSPKLKHLDPMTILKDIKENGKVEKTHYITNLSKRKEQATERNRVFATKARELKIPTYTGHGLRAAMAMLLTAAGVEPREIMNYLGWADEDIVERYRKGIQEGTLRNALSKVVQFEPTETIGERIEKIFLQHNTIEGIQFFRFLRRRLGLKEEGQGENENKRRRIKTLRKDRTRKILGKERNADPGKPTKINIYTRKGQNKIENLTKGKKNTKK